MKTIDHLGFESTISEIKIFFEMLSLPSVNMPIKIIGLELEIQLTIPISILYIF